MSIELEIKARALEIGFDLIGLAPVAVWEDLRFSRRWVEQGFGGEMKYLANPKRDDPRLVLPSARSVICTGLIYNAPLPYSTECGADIQPACEHRQDADAMDVRHKTSDSESRAWISRYAWGSDYHKVMRKKLDSLRAEIVRLAPQAETSVYVDTGPIVERAFARYSGIGWMGKNTCLINEQKGSWFFLGVLLTNLDLGPDLPTSDRCGSCTRCIEACPTGALDTPYVMDASKCIAYFTIELKGAIPAEFRSAIGTNVFGCDICQDVCPWNGRSQKSEARSQETEDKIANGGGVLPHQADAINHPPSSEDDFRKLKGFGRMGAATTSFADFQPLEIPLPAIENRGSDTRRRKAETFSLFNPRLEDLAAMSEEDFRHAFAHSPIKRAKYRGWLRNLCIAMGNARDPRFLPKLRELATHADAVIREHALWALDRIMEGNNSSRTKVSRELHP